MQPRIIDLHASRSIGFHSFIENPAGGHPVEIAVRADVRARDRLPILIDQFHSQLQIVRICWLRFVFGINGRTVSVQKDEKRYEHDSTATHDWYSCGFWRRIEHPVVLR